MSVYKIAMLFEKGWWRKGISTLWLIPSVTLRSIKRRLRNSNSVQAGVHSAEKANSGLRWLLGKGAESELGRRKHCIKCVMLFGFYSN